ncbi:hypothetical protein B0H14DRAFT_2627746 [Mycena olivaceomarginata]|nr:hypothetical protein B0H14DRAFT_2627746 [Mycena olivaceomarginata]
MPLARGSCPVGSQFGYASRRLVAIPPLNAVNLRMKLGPSRLILSIQQGKIESVKQVSELGAPIQSNSAHQNALTPGQLHSKLTLVSSLESWEQVDQCLGIPRETQAYRPEQSSKSNTIESGPTLGFKSPRNETVGTSVAVGLGMAWVAGSGVKTFGHKVLLTTSKTPEIHKYGGVSVGVTQPQAKTKKPLSDATKVKFTTVADKDWKDRDAILKAAEDFMTSDRPLPAKKADGQPLGF